MPSRRYLSFIFCCLSLAVAVAVAAQGESPEQGAEAIRLGGDIEILPGDELAVELQVQKTAAAHCYCEQRTQTDTHRRYCEEDLSVGDTCVKDTLPIDFAIEFYEAKIIRENRPVKTVATGSGFFSLSACHDFLSRYPGCAEASVEPSTEL